MSMKNHPLENEGYLEKRCCVFANLESAMLPEFENTMESLPVYQDASPHITIKVIPNKIANCTHFM